MSDKKKWKPEWAERRYTVRLSPESEHQLVNIARKASVESKTSVTVPDLIEMGIDSWLLEHKEKLKASLRAKTKGR